MAGKEKCTFLSSVGYPEDKKLMTTNNMLKIIEIKAQKEKEDLNQFLEENEASLLQTLDWGKFQEAVGRKFFCLVVKDNNKLIGSALILKHFLPFGRSYYYCPKGPVVNYQISINNYQNVLELLVKKIKELAQKEKVIFLKIEPEWLKDDQEKIQVLKNLGFKKARKEIQPKDTLILDITKSADDLLSQMHYKTRYNIRLSQRKGVIVRQTIDLKDSEIFYQLLKKTSRRDQFRLHPKEYYQKQLAILGQKGLVKLFLAEFNQKVIAGILVSFCNNKATYLHGAFDFKYRTLMAPHLLQWEAILEAKRRNFQYYDFWGIAPSEAGKNHPWQGVTRFKRGFGGEEINYIGPWDYVFSPFWYKLYNLGQILKGRLR